MTTVYFATNRRLEPGDEFGDAFADPLDELRFGHVFFDGTQLFKHDVERLAARGKITVEPEALNPTDATLSKLGSREVFSQLRAELNAGADALLYIHGYDYTFRASAARTAQLHQWLATAATRPIVPMLFAWPSRGAGVAPGTYRDDRSRAQASGPALARAILKATDFIRATPRVEHCDGRIHLLAHSMGNWALRYGVQAMRTFVGDNIPPLFEEVLLTAADEDDDTLGKQHKLAPLLRGCRRVTVYFNQQDLALKASDVALGNPDRLGKSGPEDSDALPDKVVPVNVSPVIIGPASGKNAWTADSTGHQYYRNNGVVRDDLIQVLASKPTADISNRTERKGYWRLG